MVVEGAKHAVQKLHLREVVIDAEVVVPVISVDVLFVCMYFVS